MAKKTVPLFEIQQHCAENGLTNFKVGSFTEEMCTIVEFEESHRHEHYEIIWLKNGAGTHHIDFTPHSYSGSVLFMLAPGQIHKIDPIAKSEGFILKFLPSVFAYENDFKHYILNTCLFDTSVHSPVIQVPNSMEVTLQNLFGSLTREFQALDEDSLNIVSSYLKILITNIDRIQRKTQGQENLIQNPRYDLFLKFKVAIETQYKNHHTVQHYASNLGTQARVLNSVAREFADKSAGEIIHDRILLEAKRSLYHEVKSIKEISYALGFEDPAYFTRFFKKNSGLSPQEFKAQKSNSVLV